MCTSIAVRPLEIPKLTMAGQLMQLRDGRQLSYIVSAPQTTSRYDPILLSNSLCAPYESWDFITDQFTAQGFRIIRYDQAGHGASTSPKDPWSMSFEILADDAAELLKHLGVEKLQGWIGVSMGAATGMYFSTRYPGIVKHLVICDTISMSPVNAGVTDVFAARAKAAEAEGHMNAIVDQTIGRWLTAPWRERNPKEVARVRSIMRGTTTEGFIACCAALSSDTFDLRPIARNLGHCVEEVTIVVGENDANLPESMADLRKLIMQGTKGDQLVDMHVIKNAGHVCYIDNPKGFIDAVSRSLIGTKATL